MTRDEPRVVSFPPQSSTSRDPKGKKNKRKVNNYTGFLCPIASTEFHDSRPIEVHHPNREEKKKKRKVKKRPKSNRGTTTAEMIEEWRKSQDLTENFVGVDDTADAGGAEDGHTMRADQVARLYCLHASPFLHTVIVYGFFKCWNGR